MRRGAPAPVSYSGAGYGTDAGTLVLRDGLLGGLGGLLTGFGALSPLPMTQEGLAALMQWVPALSRLDPSLLAWIAGIASSDAAGVAADNPAVWVVTPQDGSVYYITGKILGSSSRWKEMRDANIPTDAGGKAHKQGSDGGLSNLQPGDRLHIPAAWFPNGPPAVQPNAPPGSGLPGSTLLGFTYRVVEGDYPSAIASKLIGVANKWPELVAANPQKPIEGGGGDGGQQWPPVAIIPEWTDASGPNDGNFKTLYEGEILNLPDVWIPQMVARGTMAYAIAPGEKKGRPPGGQPIPVPQPNTPPVPPTPSLPTIAFGTWLQVQAHLAAWARWSGQCDPTDYGGIADFTGVGDARTTRALASYQRWANRTKNEALRTDGALDGPTQASLAATVAGILTTTPPGATPPGVIPGATPPLGGGGNGGGASEGSSNALAIGVVVAVAVVGGGVLLLRKPKKA